MENDLWDLRVRQREKEHYFTLGKVLEERIRKGKLQYILGIELGYFCFDCVSAVKMGLIDEAEHPYVIIPVWEVRGFDIIMKDIWHDHCATCSLEEDVLYDMDYADPENIQPMFFRAKMKDGVIDLRHCEVIR